MKKIFVAGHTGMVGSAICRQLQQQSHVKIITSTRKELDLCNQSAVQEFMKSEKPDEVILAAAKVGGIHANNTYPAEFIYQNLQIQNNVIHAVTCFVFMHREFGAVIDCRRRAARIRP